MLPPRPPSSRKKIGVKKPVKTKAGKMSPQPADVSRRPALRILGRQPAPLLVVAQRHEKSASC
jgi:hypothetical protein